MTNYKRFAIYYAPEPGPLADFGASWLGWDMNLGARIAHPNVDGVDVGQVTDTPRKYGLHGTVKPPFRLADGTDLDGLCAAAEAYCASQTPVQCDSLQLSRLGGFLALTPTGDTSALAALAGGAVDALDAFRAPATEAELTRRREANLSDRQEALLTQWGYPYVMDEFRFHITLSGRLGDQAEVTRAALDPLVSPLLPTPFVVRDLCLVGEDDAGMFHMIHRYALSA